MRICLLTNQDLDADPFPADDWPCDPRPYLPEASWETAKLTKSTSVSRIRALARQGFDLFFNFCDGAADQKTPGIEVVRTLEELGVPFTGATSTPGFGPPRGCEGRLARCCRVTTACSSSGESFKDSKVKWVEYHQMSCFPVADQEMAELLRDYPPSDPGSADLCLLQDPAGHEGFTRQLVRAALARHRRGVSAGAEARRDPGDQGSPGTEEPEPCSDRSRIRSADRDE